MRIFRSTYKYQVSNLIYYLFPAILLKNKQLSNRRWKFDVRIYRLPGHSIWLIWTTNSISTWSLVTFSIHIIIVKIITIIREVTSIRETVPASVLIIVSSILKRKIFYYLANYVYHSSSFKISITVGIIAITKNIIIWKPILTIYASIGIIGMIRIFTINGHRISFFRWDSKLSTSLIWNLCFFY